jgi:hypothetical protein
VNDWVLKDFITMILKSSKQEKSRETQKAKQDRYEFVPG